MKKTIAKIMLFALIAAPVAGMLPLAASAMAPNWDVSGSWSVDMHFSGTDNTHNMSLTQDGSGNLTGSGSSGAYTWVIDSGTVSGNSVNFTAHYTATSDAVTPLTTLTVATTIASDGTMSGTWSDNYQGGSRTGDFTTITGAATALPGIMTDPATGITSSDATLNGTNGNVAADQESFWVSPTPGFDVSTPNIPAGVYSTPVLPGVAANTAFSDPLSLVTTNGIATGGAPGNLPPITPSTPYYFVAWSHVNGNWIHGDILSLTTAAAPQTTVKVTIVKYIDGVLATPSSANSQSFPMSATWTAANLNGGAQTSGTYPLSIAGFNNPTPYEATTSDMTSGASYSTNEVTTGPVVGAACTQTEGGPMFALTGYSTGDTLAAAQAADSTMTIPALTNITTDKFIIVHNTLCTTGSTGNGDLGGTVTANNGVLHVDSITVNKGDSSADGTFAGGWKYTFHITAPTNEQNLAMKFSDWLSGANTIPVASNMRISSAQADNVGATILLTAANTYSTPPLHMTGDLDAGTIGRQVDVVVEVSVPIGTVPGSYTTTYGVNTTP